MKKPYVKPGLYIEDFSLSQSIAAGGCGAAQDSSLGRPGMASKNTCGWIVGDIMVWNNSLMNVGCEFPASESYNGVCYNNPDGGVSIFGLS